MATTLIHARGRNDDGNETTATWKAPEDQDWTQAVDTNFRVRFKVQNDTAAINNLDVQLQYQLNGGGWVNVTATSNVVRSSASANLADAANLTEQLSGGTGTFIGATAFDEVNGICGGNSLDVTSTGKFETEFCCQLRSADVVRGDKIELRTINSDTGSPWTTYNVTPLMTAIGPNINVGDDLGAVAESITLALNPASFPITVTENDTVTIAEDINPQIRLQPQPFESVAVSEDITRRIRIDLNFDEAIVAWDLSNQEINYWITVTDDATVVLIAEGAGRSVNQNDEVTLADESTVMVLLQPQRDDAVTVADVPTINLLEMPQVADAVTVAEFAIGSPVLQPQQFESIAVAEDITPRIVLQPQPFETVTVAEDITPRLFILPQHFDGVAATDASEVLLPKLFVDRGDDITVSESAIVSTGVVGTIPVETFDAVAAGEQATVLLPKLPIIVDDPVTIVEQIVSRVPFLGVTINDSVTIAERVAASRLSKPSRGMTKTQWQTIWNDNINQINARFGTSLNNVGATGWGTALNNNFATLNSTFGLSLVQPSTGTTDWDVILNANLDAINAGLPW